VGEIGSTLATSLTTLAEAVHAGGYRTGAFVANGILSASLGYGQGFEIWDDSLHKHLAVGQIAALGEVEVHKPLLHTRCIAGLVGPEN